MNIIVRKPTDAEKAYMEGKPTWTCHVAEFDCYYSCDETFLIADGNAIMEFEGGSVSFGAGDIVTVFQGVESVWKVINPITKHYEETMNVSVRKPTEEEKIEMMKNPEWTCGSTSFDCLYSSEETCFFLEGDVSISFGDGNMIRFGAGDLVRFPQGFSCAWRVDSPVKMHYTRVRR